MIPLSVRASFILIIGHRLAELLCGVAVYHLAAGLLI
jgi:hypothetical protein